jgi:hypothetical protein
VTNAEMPGCVGALRGVDGETRRDAVVVRTLTQCFLMTAAAALVQVSMLAGGYAAGLSPRAASLRAVAILSGMALAVVSAFLPQPAATRSVNRLSMFGLCVYVFFLDSAGVLLVGYTPSILAAVTFLSPVIVGGVLLPRRGSWLGGLGCGLVLFSATECLTYNVAHDDSGLSFFWGWVF